MSDEGLYRLYKLHQVDAQLHTLKSRAGALDTGNAEAAQYKRIQIETKMVRQKAKQLSDQLTALKDRRADNAAKADKYETQLFDGSIVNPREIEDLLKEASSLRALDPKLEKEIAVLKPDVDEAVENASSANAQLKKLRETVLTKQEKAKALHGALQEEYMKVKATRAEIAKDVDPLIMREYDAARKKTGNTGLALITEDSRCSSCGIDIPEKTRQLVRIGKVMHCESCRRVLFIYEPDDA